MVGPHRARSPLAVCLTFFFFFFFYHHHFILPFCRDLWTSGKISLSLLRQRGCVWPVQWFQRGAQLTEWTNTTNSAVLQIHFLNLIISLASNMPWGSLFSLQPQSPSVSPFIPQTSPVSYLTEVQSVLRTPLGTPCQL